MNDSIEENAQNPEIAGTMDRRTLLRGAAGAGAGLFLSGLLAGCGGSGSGTSLVGGGSTSSGVSDADVLNFALNLEYLEAEYYLRGTTGNGLSAADAGTSASNVTGGSQVPGLASSPFGAYFQEIAQDELEHVRFLRSALGGSAVARPAIDLQASFNAAAQAAGLGSSFNPFADPTSFLIGAFIFEDVGVSAYRGGATLLSNKTYLSAAAGILGTEAYHAGSLRTLLLQTGGSAVDAANKIAALRDNVSGGNTDVGLNTGGSTHFVDADSNGIAFVRTTSQVLKVVYLGGTSSGGFFPQGLNGKVK